jgi:hypothetical protein
MQHDVLQAALAVHRDFRQPRDRVGIEHAFRDDAQPPGLLRDQQAPVGQERHRPRLLQPLDHLGDTKRVLVRAEGLCRRRER